MNEGLSEEQNFFTVVSSGANLTLLLDDADETEDAEDNEEDTELFLEDIFRDDLSFLVMLLGFIVNES